MTSNDSHACVTLAPQEIDKMAEILDNQPEPQIFVVKQGPQESNSAFEARISDLRQEISGSDFDRPVILYSVAQPTHSSSTANLTS
jgi:hypothetical protein